LYDPDLRIDRAVIGGKVGDRALRCGMRIADEPGGRVDDGVFGIRAVAGILGLLNYATLYGELHLEIGVTAGLGSRWYGRK
jgi:hypothetical protein